MDWDTAESVMQNILCAYCSMTCMLYTMSMVNQLLF